MGKKAKEIVKGNVNEIIELLNRALADELLAYYQYWVGSKIAKGPMRAEVSKELEEHAKEEFDHAEMLINRILTLGGTPYLEPKDFVSNTNCGYIKPEPSTKSLVMQNLKGERCAIEVYVKILEKAKECSDYITFHMIRKILEKEVEHEDDLERLLEDLESLGV